MVIFVPRRLRCRSFPCPDVNASDRYRDQEYRCSAADLATLKKVQDSLNAQYGSSIVTEFAMNGAGILEQV